MTAHECVAKNMIHLRDALFICAALYLRSVSTLSFHFIMLITRFFINHSRLCFVLFGVKSEIYINKK